MIDGRHAAPRIDDGLGGLFAESGQEDGERGQGQFRIGTAEELDAVLPGEAVDEVGADDRVDGDRFCGGDAGVGDPSLEAGDVEWGVNLTEPDESRESALTNEKERGEGIRVNSSAVY